MRVDRESLPQQLNALQQAIRMRHGCASTYSQTRYGRASDGEVNSRDRIIYVFRLIDHPQAKCCYAWKQDGAAGTALVTVLEVPPVHSPETALRHAAAPTAGVPAT